MHTFFSNSTYRQTYNAINWDKYITSLTEVMIISWLNYYMNCWLRFLNTVQVTSRMIKSRQLLMLVSEISVTVLTETDVPTTQWWANPESRFDLNHDFNATRDSIWLLKIRLRPTGFGIRFANFCDSIWSCKIWEPNPWIRNVYAARVLVGPFPFHNHSNNIASENASSATKESKWQLGWRCDVPGAATYKWPTRDILGVKPVGRLSNPAITGYLTWLDLAKKYLIIPATSASVERLFSVVGAIVRARRNRLSASTVESLLLRMQHWFYKSM